MIVFNLKLIDETLRVAFPLLLASMLQEYQEGLKVLSSS